MSLSSFGNSREHFEKIEKLYKDYVKLYKFFNKGSLQGVASFVDFYWMHHFYWKHHVRRL